jgi:hypothetical protein
MYSFLPQSGLGVDLAFKTNEYQEYFLRSKGARCLGLATLPPLCVDSFEIWEPQTVIGFCRDYLNFIYLFT